MESIRRRLTVTAWFIFVFLLTMSAVLRPRLPKRLPAQVGPDGTPLTWTDRDTFFVAYFTIFALLLVFSILIDRFLLRKFGENAFLATITLFLTCIFFLAFLPPLAAGLGSPQPLGTWLILAVLMGFPFFLAYRYRMRSLQREDEIVVRGADYFRRLKPTGLMAWIPVSYPFFPYSISLNKDGLLLRGVLLGSLWPWDQIASAKPGKAFQAYSGSAIRLAVSGKEVVVISLKNLRWPVVTNAPDRDLFLEAVRRHAPLVQITLSQ